MSREFDYLHWAHPLVRDWFKERFIAVTQPQKEGWPHILAGKNTLISAPTGSGKTLAAFLICIDSLIRQSLAGTLKDEITVVYISPLKALSNDVKKNLEEPLAEIYSLAGKQNIAAAPVRIAVRTGDTPPTERRSMLRKPPHILVTTPESFYLLLTAEKSRKLMQNVKTVIVDEIHAVIDDKRGAHLAISLERLNHLVEKEPLRIGLSATQNPIELVAQYLVGSKRPLPALVNVGHRRNLDLAVEVPSSPLAPVASNELWEEIYDRLARLVNEHRSTLIFVNTRKQAERLTMNLAKRLGEQFVATHHGSLSRKIRLEAENKLKNGDIKGLVATASLELGIDIGFVDLVCQLGSPRSIATTLQRIGRSGHWLGAIPKGRLFATTRDELIELAALGRAIAHGDLDKLSIPDKPFDILAQQMVAMCAVEDWKETELLALIKNAYPYRNLTRKEYIDVVTVLTEGISARRGRYGSYLFHDQVNGRLKGRRGARLTAITSAGAIPEANLYQVVVEPDGTMVGTLDEDFAIECNRGDIILLGNTSWRIRRIENAAGRVSVEDAKGAPPTVPFWLGEGPSRTAELSQQVSALRKQVSDMTLTVPHNFMLGDKAGQVAIAINHLKQECMLDQSGAEQVIEYVIEGRNVLNAIPTQLLIIAERFFDEGGGMQLVIHSPFGGRINKAWGLALRKKFCRSFNFELQAAATDNGLNIALGEQHSFPLADVFHYLTPGNLKETLEQAVLASPIFATRWRWDAIRSLALPRFAAGKKIPPYIQRLKADDLLAAVFPGAAACQDNVVGDIELPDHPLVKEVMKDVLTEALDIDGLQALIEGLAKGDIKYLAVDTPVPSVFSHEILNANPYAYLDDAPLEERRARAVEMRRMLPDSVIEEVGYLDDNAIAKVREEVWPDLRSADELHDFLQTVIALPENLAFLPYKTDTTPQDWSNLFLELVKERRAECAAVVDRPFWTCAERANYFQSIYPGSKFQKQLPSLSLSPIAEAEAVLSMIQGWMNYCGPVTIDDLSQLLLLPAGSVEIALLQLECSGSVLRGKFTRRTPASSKSSVENNNWQWCHRRLLARIHRLTLANARKQVESVTASMFWRWLSHWQHVAPGSQLSGERGLLNILSQLQGFEVAANAWERQVLARRVSNYDPTWLDHLCLSGSIGWGRLSPHPALSGKPINGLEKKSITGRRVIPTSVAPVTFFVRDDSDWMISHHPEKDNEKSLSAAAKSVEQFLSQRGASFFSDIVRHTGLLKAEVESALWELVAAGLITADGFDNLRALIDPKRRAGQGRGRYIRPRNSVGRWSLLHNDQVNDTNKIIEATCRMLLNRYGIIFRDLLSRESLPFTWRQLLITLRFMEARGEIYGGIFVSGFLGEQFALPEALESLRSFRLRPVPGQPVVLSATDPLNLIGILTPGERVSAVSGKVITIES